MHTGFPSIRAWTLALVGCTGFAAAAEDYGQWSYSRVLHLDGTALEQDLAGYPLLVRFGTDAAEYLAKANPDGSDLRFSLADGTHLAYQLDSWDPAAGGVVWVRLPLVKAGVANQVRVHCGKPGAPDSSNGPAVFRASEGFQGVWHMDPSLRDAGPNGILAVDSGTTSAPMGAIGAARLFTNPEAYATKGDYLTLGNPAALNITGVLTLEAWVRWTRRDGHRIVICHGSAPGSAFETVLRIGETRDYRAGVWTGSSHYAALEAPAADSNAWVHLAGVYTGTRWLLFRNGAQFATTVADTNGAKASPGAWRIGAEYAGGVTRFFDGMLDEVRIASSARGADWFKMEYATQRAGQTAIKWEATSGLRADRIAPLVRRERIRIEAGVVRIPGNDQEKGSDAAGRAWPLPQPK